jgi:hypothetical protein
MDIGMLWYDGDTKRTLDAKVASAVAYYQTKYGATPTVCFVHPSMLAPALALTPDTRPTSRASAGESAGVTSEQNASAGVQLRPARVVMVNHFWLGVGENASGVEPQRGNGAHPKKSQGADT